MSSKSDLRLDWCSHDAAKYAVEHWHYARTITKGPCQYIGVWEDGRFIGSVIFGMGGGGATDGRRYGLARSFEMCELVRVALTRHSAPVSRIVAVALRMVQRHNPGLRLVVSYADPAHDHRGGIYQAGGWIYVGASAPDHYFVATNGRRYHSRSVRAVGFVLRFGRPTYAPKPSDMTRFETPGKHKYLMPLDAEMRARIAPLAKPYPRASRLESEAPGVQPGTEGAAMRPTRSTLQAVSCG